jgi:hypothetical protein
MIPVFTLVLLESVPAAPVAGVAVVLRWITRSAPVRGPPAWVRVVVVAGLVAVLLVVGGSPAWGAEPTAEHGPPGAGGTWTPVVLLVAGAGALVPAVVVGVRVLRRGAGEWMGQVGNRLRSAWPGSARAWVRWTVRAVVVVAAVAALVLLFALPVGAVSATAPSTAAGGRRLTGAAEAVGVVAALAGSAVSAVVVAARVRGAAVRTWGALRSRLTGAGSAHGPPGGSLRRAGGELTGRQGATSARWLAKQYRRGETVVVPVAVRDARGAVVGVLHLFPVRGLSAWALRTFGVDDLVAFAWAGSGERLVAVDAELFARIQRVDEAIAVARDQDLHTQADGLQRLLDGWVLDVFRHENVHFDHPDARHGDHVFDGHRDVRHHLLDQAVDLAVSVNQLLGRSPTSQPAPVRGRQAARQQAMQTAVEGWARLPEPRLGAGEAARWDVWRLLGALWYGDGAAGGRLRQTHMRGLSAEDLVTQVGELGQRLADGQPIDAPGWAAGLIRQMVARGLGEPTAAGPVAAWLGELADKGLLVRETDVLRVERFRPGGVFGQMLARAPPQVGEALWRNPLGVAGVGIIALPFEAQAAAIRTWLSGVVPAWGHVERGLWLAVPLRLRAWRFAGELRWAVKASRLALIDVVNASDELARGLAAGVTGGELAALVAARDAATARSARIVREAREGAAARGLSAYRVRDVGQQPRLLVDYERRIYLSLVQTGFVLAAGLVVHPVAAAVLSLVMFWPHWKPRRAGGYDRMTLRERVSSWPKRVRDTRWERGGALGYSFPFWKLAIPVPLAGLGVLAALHPATAWVALMLSVVTVEVSTSGELVVGRVPDPVADGLRSVQPEDRNWWVAGLPVYRVSLSLVVFGAVKISVFVQQFSLLGTAFGQVPGVLPPKIVGFQPWLRLKARWASYDKGVWSKTASQYTFWQGGFGFGPVGGVLVEPRRTIRKAIVRAVGRQRLTVDFLLGPHRASGKAVFALLRGIARLVPAEVRDGLVRLTAWRAAQADRQQARHARTMLGLIEAVLARQQARLVEVNAQLAGAQVAKRTRLQRAVGKLEAAIQVNQEHIAAINGLRFDRYRLARAHRMMSRANTRLEQAERRLRAVEETLRMASTGRRDRLLQRRTRLQADIVAQQNRRQAIRVLLDDIAAAPAGLPAVQPNWLARARHATTQWLVRVRDVATERLVRLRDGTRNWLREVNTWLVTKRDAVSQWLAQAWARPWVRWTVRGLLVVAAVVAVVVLLTLPADAASGTASRAATGGGWPPGVADAVAVVAMLAGSVVAVVAGAAVLRWMVRSLKQHDRCGGDVGGDSVHGVCGGCSCRIFAKTSGHRD